MEEYMRLSHFFSVLGTAFLIVGPALADDGQAPITAGAGEVDAQASGEPADDLAWGQFDDPNFDPSTATAPKASGTARIEADTFANGAPNEGRIELAASVAPEATSSGVVLGPKGTDDQGRSGRLHTVARGDTLWDLSAAYLGTPWVWPSVWTDNDDIANPHLIVPGDMIWITANEMRVLTDAEVESFLSPVSEETVASVVELPAAAAPTDDMLAALEGMEDDLSTLDAFPVAIPGQDPTSMAAGRQVTIARRDSMGFVSADDLEGASTVVESPSERTFLSFGDRVYLGLGEGDVEVGDQFTAIGAVEEVRDIETNRLLGHHVENYGWIEIIELTGDTSVGEIRQSFSEMRRGVQIVPRENLSRRVTVRTTPDAIEGQVSFMPSDRTLMADGGYVYLNRGEFHGVEVGSELEVFESGQILNERERRVDVRTPDKGIATLVVVKVEPESSVAFVLSADREIAVGDYVRPMVDRRMAQR
jgi:hypothetical protein